MSSRLLGACVLAFLLALGLAGGVVAHAELIESEPAEGGTIETPSELRARFSIELDPNPERSFVIVRDAGGAEVARGGVRSDDPSMMSVELPALAAGDYHARWQAFDPTDGHAERGTINFTIVEPVPTATAAAPTPTAAPATTLPGTAAPTMTASPSPTPAPTPSPSPEPGNGEQTAGMTDVLLALVLAGAVIGGLALYLLRRR